MKFNGLLIILIFPSFLSIHISAQNSDSIEVKNNPCKSDIFFNAGFLGVWLVGNINAERQIVRREALSLYVRAGVGGLASWGPARAEYIVSLTSLSGRNGHYFESNLGICALKETGYKADIWPYVYLGYRKQKPGKSRFLRLGAGFPDSICIGMGFCL